MRRIYRTDEKTLEALRRIYRMYVRDLDEPLEIKYVRTRVIQTIGLAVAGRLVRVSERAIEEGLKALREGATVLCDALMTETGIRYKIERYTLPNRVISLSSLRRSYDEGLAEQLSKVDSDIRRSIIVIGASPKVLNTILDNVRKFEPRLIIASPPGFIDAPYVKRRLVIERPCEYMTILGTLGSSMLAMALFTALLEIDMGYHRYIERP
ncbi:MAG: hypothetical protein GXO23_00040 [Crenarchaeota archaeon]|nr:hypothetical protein [Thermoproteota archaeon]